MATIRIIFPVDPDIKEHMGSIVEFLDQRFPNDDVVGIMGDDDDRVHQAVDVDIHVTDDWGPGPILTPIQQLQPGQRIGPSDSVLSRASQIQQSLQLRLDNLRGSLNFADG